MCCSQQQEDYTYEPWGHGVGSPRRDAVGNVYRYRYHDKQEGNMVHPHDLTNTFKTRIDVRMCGRSCNWVEVCGIAR